MKNKDIRSVYYADLRAKKAIAVSARAAARLKYAKGARNYTRKELEAMSGPTYSVNLKEPITYEKFKGLPRDLQCTYLDHIFKEYKIGPSAISRMLGISNQYCGKLLRDLGYTFPTRASKDAEKAFEYFCKSAKPSVPVIEQALKTTAITFTGLFSAESIATELSKYFTEGEKITISASISD